MQTLSDLIESFHLYGVCETCQRVAKVDLQMLIDKLGPDYTVAQVRQRLRCQGCHTRTQNMRIVYVGPGGRAAGFNYRR